MSNQSQAANVTNASPPVAQLQVQIVFGKERA
jgi:hypothetical protein